MAMNWRWPQIASMEDRFCFALCFSSSSLAQSQAPDVVTGAVTVPISLASTFAQVELVYFTQTEFNFVVEISRCPFGKLTVRYE
jgi:hypothetical protein